MDLMHLLEVPHQLKEHPPAQPTFPSTAPTKVRLMATLDVLELECCCCIMSCILID
jgi:hypothetical protein